LGFGREGRIIAAMRPLLTGLFMNINEATEADFQVATHRVFRSKSRPSAVRIGVLQRNSDRRTNAAGRDPSTR
jgi:hypothetical protein